MRVDAWRRSSPGLEISPVDGCREGVRSSGWNPCMYPSCCSRLSAFQVAPGGGRPVHAPSTPPRPKALLREHQRETVGGDALARRGTTYRFGADQTPHATTPLSVEGAPAGLKRRTSLAERPPEHRLPSPLRPAQLVWMGARADGWSRRGRTCAPDGIGTCGRTFFRLTVTISTHRICHA